LQKQIFKSSSHLCDTPTPKKRQEPLSTSNVSFLSFKITPVQLFCHIDAENVAKHLSVTDCRRGHFNAKKDQIKGFSLARLPNFQSVLLHSKAANFILHQLM